MGFTNANQPPFWFVQIHLKKKKFPSPHFRHLYLLQGFNQAALPLIMINKNHGMIFPSTG